MGKEKTQIIICEACTNWQDLSEAKQIIKVAKEAGAGLVKFQLFNADDDKGKPHYQWVKDHELGFLQTKLLFDTGVHYGIEVFFSVFGLQYVEWCEKIGVKRYKIACTYRDKAVLRAIERSGKPAFISVTPDTYSSHLTNIFSRAGKWERLFCVPDYPAIVKEMPIFQAVEEWPYYDGFSDHTIGLDAAKIALARGAKYIEKHFCLEHDPAFPDNLWAITPEELRELVRWDTVCRTIL